MLALLCFKCCLKPKESTQLLPKNDGSLNGSPKYDGRYAGIMGIPTEDAYIDMFDQRLKAALSSVARSADAKHSVN